MGINKHRVHDGKILSSIVEVSKCDRYFYISDGNLSEDGQVEANAYGSPLAALDRAQDIVQGGKALIVTNENNAHIV